MRIAAASEDRPNAVVFFLHLDSRDKAWPSFPPGHGEFWHTGIVVDGWLHECFSAGKFARAPANMWKAPAAGKSVWCVANVDKGKVKSELESGTDCAEYVARCLGMSWRTGPSKGTLWPSDVMRKLKDERDAKFVSMREWPWLNAR